MTNTAFPQKELRALCAALKLRGDKELPIVAELESAISCGDFEKYNAIWTKTVDKMRALETLEWGKLFAQILVALNTHHKNYTVSQKQAMLRKALAVKNSPPEVLFERLEKLMQTWGEKKEDAIPLTSMDFVEKSEDSEESKELQKDEESENATESTQPAQESEESDDCAELSDGISLETFSEIKKLFAELLTQTLRPFVQSDDQLSDDVDEIAQKLLHADSIVMLANLAADVKRLSFKLELFAEEHAAQTQGIFNLVRLMVNNAESLSAGDQWLNGQMEMLKEVIDKPLSLRALNEAQRRLSDVVFKQEKIKKDLTESRGTLTTLIAGFVEQIAGFSESTSDYHDKLSNYAQKISKLEDIKELDSLLTDVMSETQEMQKSTQTTRAELICAQERAKLAQARVLELEKNLEETSALITHDTLTGVLNRRGLDDVMLQEISRAQRAQQKMCVALLDLDNFKKLNDNYGHDAGDAALKYLAKMCKNFLRPQDSVARYGGEEFVIVLPGADAHEGKNIAQRLQRALTKEFFLHNNEKLLITFSAGVAELNASDTPEELIKRADTAMYAAKKSGKNRVLVSVS